MIANFAFYWQWPMPEGIKTIPYYTMLEAHGNLVNGTTVPDTTLEREGIAVPPTPSYSTWADLTRSGERCRNCWAEGDCAHRKRERRLA